MSRLSLRWCLAVAALIGAVAEPRGAAPAPRRETPRQGLVATVPYVGRLTWRCDDNRRFSTRLTLPAPGATVTAGVVTDGKPVVRRRPVRSVFGPSPARRSQTWTIRYHHKPATVLAIVRLRFAASRITGDCQVTHAKIDVRRTPHWPHA
jgi:hypothetical protein